MQFDKKTGTLTINDKVFLSRVITKRELIDDAWEPWQTNALNDEEYIVYRRLFTDNEERQKYGDLRAHVILTRPADDDSQIEYWKIYPLNLLEGIQNRPKGRVTKKLDQWFRKMTNCPLPAKPIGEKWILLMILII